MAVATDSTMSVELVPLDRIHANCNLRDSQPSPSIREASSGTRVTITGCLVADPELRHTAAGVAWSRLCVALRGTDGTILQDVLVSGDVAEAAAPGLRSGNRVRVTGSIRGRRWTDDDGVACYDVSIMAGTVEILSGAVR